MELIEVKIEKNMFSPFPARLSFRTILKRDYGKICYLDDFCHISFFCKTTLHGDWMLCQLSPF